VIKDSLRSFEKEGQQSGRLCSPALTSFQGDLFLTSRCASLIIFGDIRPRPLEELVIRIQKERRLKKENDTEIEKEDIRIF
jgi:hypothetical protein